MVGKFLVGKKTTINGYPVTVLCGVVKGHHIVENDNYNGVLLSLHVTDQRIANDDIKMSPEDFLENLDEIDWSKK